MDGDQNPRLEDLVDEEQLESDPSHLDGQESLDPQPSQPQSQSRTQPTQLKQVDLSPILHLLQTHFIEVNATLSAIRSKVNHVTSDLNFFKAEAYIHFSNTQARLDEIELALATQVPPSSSPTSHPNPDLKGKTPLTSPFSPHPSSSPIPHPPISSPHSHHTPTTTSALSPQPIPVESDSSSSSSSQSASQYVLVPHPPSPTHPM